MSDVMLFGVLRMPYEMAMSTELSRRQFYARAQEAADRLEALSTHTAQAAEAPDAWRQAVDRELTAIGQTVDSYATPLAAVRALIDWHCAVQIDPAVSSAAAELVERGRREAAQAVRQEPVDRVRIDSVKVHIVPLVRDVQGSPPKDGQTLYFRQPPQPVALTDEQFAASLPDEVARSYTPEQLDVLEQGFRHAERAHGITPTEQQEQPR